MRFSRSILLAAATLVAFVVLFLPEPLLSQSCALCYTQAAGSGSRMIQALKSGILILIAPPTLMSVGLIFVCYRKRNKTRREADEFDSDWGNGETEDWNND
jgi:hypothetical protein